MKKIAKILLWVAGVIIVIFVLLSIGVALFAKPVVISQIENTLKLKTSLDSLSLSFPLSVNIRNLNIQGLAKVEDISLRPSLLGFLAGKIVLNELRVIKPEITLVMGKDGKLNFQLPEGKGKQPPVFLAGLEIRKGKILFIDRKVDPAGYKIALRDIEVKISKVSFPITSLLANFDISAVLGEAESKGTVSASGWIDFGPKNMEGKIELKDIAMSYFTPYFREFQEFIPGDISGSAKLSATSDLTAVNNNLSAKCRIKFMNIESGFTFRTKLDKPELDAKMIRQQVSGGMAQDLLQQLPQKIMENPDDLEKQFKELGESLKDMFLKKKD